MLTKTEFFAWLKTTRPPRRIKISGPVYYWQTRWDVGCEWDRRGHGKTLCEPIGRDSAEKHAARYRRWLEEFEAAEVGLADVGPDA